MLIVRMSFGSRNYSRVVAFIWTVMYLCTAMLTICSAILSSWVKKAKPANLDCVTP